uniref:Uncharacterized protein n=1 Tax=Dulem virus 55 TaxID=3145766 RepID=A0AAU8B3Y5_9VIRU
MMKSFFDLEFLRMCAASFIGFLGGSLLLYLIFGG